MLVKYYLGCSSNVFERVAKEPPIVVEETPIMSEEELTQAGRLVQKATRDGMAGTRGGTWEWGGCAHWLTRSMRMRGEPELAKRTR